MPLSEIIAGAALGLSLQILHEAIQKGKDRSSTTRCILERLDATLFRITPLVAKVEKLSEEADEPLRRVIKDLKHLLENAVVLVQAYVDLKRRNLLKKNRYKKSIEELEASLRWMVDVDVQVNQWADIKQIMAKMSDMNTKIEEITSRPNHYKVEKVELSLEAKDGCSNDDPKPKLDIHLRWRKQNKDHGMIFGLN